jgi:integrase
MSTPIQPIPWPEFRRMIESLYATGAKSTAAKVRQVLDLVEALGIERTDQLTTDLVSRFIQGRPAGESPWTTRALLSTLRAICTFAEGAKLVPVSPFRLKPMRKWIRTGPPTIGRVATPDEVRRILGRMQADVIERRGWAQWRARRLLALTATIAYTGVRAREGQRLWVTDLDLINGVVHLVPHGRGFKSEGAAQPVRLPAALIPYLRDWLFYRLQAPPSIELPPGCPWLFCNAHRTGPWDCGDRAHRPLGRLQALAARCGIEGMTWHALRRGWATAAEASGIPLALISRQLRHSDIDTTRRYYAARQLDSLREAVREFRL